MVFIEFVNTIFALATIRGEQIRPAVCGVYHLVFATFSLIIMCVFQRTAVTVARYDTVSYRLRSCNIIPYISLTLGYKMMWLSVGISVEKILIECSNFGLYGSHFRVILPGSFRTTRKPMKSIFESPGAVKVTPKVS